MKQIKLRKSNQIKYCLNCKEFVKIVMVNLNGYCPNETSKETGEYLTRLYTIDNSKREKI
ncbi:hypothetical protein CCP1ISM_60033 [Azospirillaceae bacterium]